MQLDDLLRELDEDGWTVTSKPYTQSDFDLEGPSGQDRIHYTATKQLPCDSWEISFNAADRTIVVGPHFAFWLSIIDRKTAYSDTSSILPTAFRPKVQITMPRSCYLILLLPIFSGCKPEFPQHSTPVVDANPSIVQESVSSSAEVNRPAPAEPEAGSQRAGNYGPLVGQPAPSLEGMGPYGKSLKLSDYRGKVVVVDFWMIGCPPCRAMIPHHRELVKRMQGRPFVLLGVNVGNDDGTAFEAFLEKEQMTWPNIYDAQTQLPAWHAGSPPTLDVVDAKGVYRYFSVDDKDLDAVVEKLVKEAESAK
jgi:thiol-disulfide isomerase/thioredoxin